MRGRAIGNTALLGSRARWRSRVAAAAATQHQVIIKNSFPQGFLPVLLEGTALRPCQSTASRNAAT
jgi:hypothetical protein